MPLLEVRGLRKWFPIRRGLFGRAVGQVRAVDGVDFALDTGRSLGLVGESGCGKTTTGRCILRLIEPTAGSVRFDGVELTGLGRGRLRRLRPSMQMVFQDPYGSLNPRMTVGAMLAEPLVVHGRCHRNEAWDRAGHLLAQVGLDPSYRHRFPHQFSGGQRQRVGIARALALAPKLIVCDEPVSSLDVSVQAQVINLLKDLQAELGVAYIFIAHDLAVVAHLCDTVAVMYLGEIVEMGPTEVVLHQPLHPYTKALLSAVPPDMPGQRQQRILLAGDPPSPTTPSSPGRFRTRFPDHAAAFPDGAPLALHQAGPNHLVRCTDLAALMQLAG